MKTSKLVLGIITIVLSCLVTLQSCAVGVANTMDGGKETSGTSGVFVAILMLSGAIVMIATRTSQNIGGSVADIIIYALAALIGFSDSGSYKDLIIWGFLCLILAIINIIAVALIKTKNPKKPNSKEESDKN